MFGNDSAHYLRNHMVEYAYSCRHFIPQPEFGKGVRVRACTIARFQVTQRRPYF